MNDKFDELRRRLPGIRRNYQETLRSIEAALRELDAIEVVLGEREGGGELSPEALALLEKWDSAVNPS